MTEGLVLAQQAPSLQVILEFLGTNPWMRHLYALASLAGFTWVLHRVLRRDGRRRGPGMGWLVIGADNRVSTSKVQVVLWSYAVAFALLSLIFHDALAPDFNLDATYLLLLGSPAAAALLAKGITTAKVRDGKVAKPRAREAPSGLAGGVAQVVSDDEGRVEIFDLQYFLFTLVALAYFALAFLTQDFGATPGLPTLPLTLVALTGVSAATYVVRKGVENEEPVLTGAYPETAFPGDTVRIRGKNLALQITGADKVQPEAVLFGGRPADPLSHTSGSVEARVPEDLGDGVASVKVMRSDGILTADGLDLRIATPKPKITAVQPTRIVLGVDHHVTIRGRGFVISEPDVATGAPAILLDGRKLETENRGWGPTSVSARVPTLKQAQEQGYTLPSTAELVVLDTQGHSSTATTVQLEAKRATPEDEERVDANGQVNADGGGRVDANGDMQMDTQVPPQPRPWPVR